MRATIFPNVILTVVRMILISIMVKGCIVA